MAVLACLGRANYWITLPFLSLLALFAVLAIISPRTIRRLLGTQYSEPVTRLIGIGLLLLVAMLATLAIDEARTDPECRMDASSTAPEASTVR